MFQFRRRRVIPLLLLLAGVLPGCASRAPEASTPVSLPAAAKAETPKPAPFGFAAVHYTYADIFEEPDIHSERLSQCVYGDVVRIVEEHAWWYRVKIGPYPELEGWMHKAALTKLSAKSLYMQERGITTIVIRQNVSRVFIWPSATVDIVMGTELPFIGEVDAWYLVRLPSNDIGRIARESVYPSPAAVPLIQSKQQPAAPAAPDIPEHRQQIVAKAREFLGITYVWGGTSPRGLDCSGLSYLVYKLNGIELPRVSWLQFRAAIGRSVDKSHLQHGDLVFFTTYKQGPSHVGIYIGRNQFIHASPTQGVTISDLDDPYFRARYIGAKTLLSAS